MGQSTSRLTPAARLRLVELVQAGRPASEVAETMGVSRSTVYKWLRRHHTDGVAGLRDRPSRPLNSPNRTDGPLEARIVSLRRGQRLGPARIARILRMNPSTVHRVLTRHGLSRLAAVEDSRGDS
ncbi:MAG: helix-turn-helix domain-containing protein [Actinomycetota bacterium]|nr:MAG: helix-turn-helix domain-containing protein [Actinomycetota bacterium]